MPPYTSNDRPDILLRFVVPQAISSGNHHFFAMMSRPSSPCSIQPSSPCSLRPCSPCSTHSRPWSTGHGLGLSLYYDSLGQLRSWLTRPDVLRLIDQGGSYESKADRVIRDRSDLFFLSYRYHCETDEMFMSRVSIVKSVLNLSKLTHVSKRERYRMF